MKTKKEDAGATFEFEYLLGVLGLVVSASFDAQWTFPTLLFVEELIIDRRATNNDIASPSPARARRILKSHNLDLLLDTKPVQLSQAQLSRIVTASGHEAPLPRPEDVLVISVPERRIIIHECLKARERRHEREAREQQPHAQKKQRKIT